MQDMQVARHSPNKGKPYLFHGVRVLWLSAVGERRQDRVPGPSWQAQQKQNRLRGYTYCMMKERSFLAHAYRMLYISFHIHDRHQLVKYDSVRAGVRLC
jgi:hypothetical protein